jgi:hypothetical protein
MIFINPGPGYECCLHHPGASRDHRRQWQLRAIQGFLIALAALLAALAVAPARATEAPVTDIPKKLDENMASILASLAFGHQISPLDFNPENSEIAPNFFVFYGLSPPPAIMGSFGIFAVNPWTGDVWALWFCKKITSPAARNFQAQIRRLFKPEEMKQYSRLRHLEPPCMYP